MIRQGQALFQGNKKLTGRIRGHDNALPPAAVRCINCHNARLLNASVLLAPQQRRGGPPSQYNAETFCNLLRTGADAAYIRIAREMPIYELTGSQCENIWSYLLFKESGHEKH